MKKNICKNLFFLIAIFFVCIGCSDSGDGSEGGVVGLGPLTYTKHTAVYSMGRAIENNVPTLIAGKVDTFSIAPSLPTGLQIDAETGVISGQPAEESLTMHYTITAKNLISAVTCEMEITVLGMQKFCVPNYGSNTVTIFDELNIQNKKNIVVGSGPRAVAYGKNKFVVANSNSDDITVINAMTEEVMELRSISVPPIPVNIAFGNGKFAVVSQVSSTETGKVTILDGDTMAILATINVGLTSEGIAYGNKRFAVVNTAGNSISLIDAVTDTLVQNIPVSESPFQIAYGNKLFGITHYKASANTNTVSLVDSSTGVLTPLAITGSHFGIAFGNTYFAVASYGSSRLRLIDSVAKKYTLYADISVGCTNVSFANNRFGILYDSMNKLSLMECNQWNLTNLSTNGIGTSCVIPGRNSFLITHEYSDHVDQVELINNTIINKTLADYHDAWSFLTYPAFSVPSESPVFCIATLTGQAYIVDARKHGRITSINLGLGNTYSYNALYGNGRFAIVNLNTNNVSFIDAENHTLMGTTAVQNGPRSIAYGNQRFAVINKGSNSVSILDATTNELKTHLPVGNNPEKIAFGNNRFAITNYDSSSVTVVDASNDSVMETIPTNPKPYGIAYGNHCFVVTHDASSDVTVLSAEDNSIITTLKAGLSPGNVAYGNHCFAIVNFSSNNITILDDSNYKTLATIPIEITNPLYVSFGNNRFCVVSLSSNKAILLDANSFKALLTINLEGSSQEAVFGNNCFYIPCTTSSNTYILDSITKELHGILTIPALSSYPVSYPSAAAFYSGKP